MTLFGYDFAHPGFFFILLVIPLMIVWYVFTMNKSVPRVKISSLGIFGGARATGLQIFRHSLPLLRIIAIAALVLAFARPQSSESWQDSNTEGIDIIIAMDVSTSMLAKDFEPNRLDASKEVAQEFIKERRNDKIGLVVYEGQSFTQCPLTTDHRVLLSLFSDVSTGWIEGGTAVGLGLATAVNRLRESEAKSKVVILLTDGVNNKGNVPPITAAEIAKEYGIRVYSIGVGTTGKALSPVAFYGNGQYQFDYVDVKIDEKTLKSIADMTGGKYFRATNRKKLQSIYQEIDQMEKTKIKITEHSTKTELFFPFALIGVIALLAEFLLKQLVFKTAP